LHEMKYSLLSSLLQWTDDMIYELIELFNNHLAVLPGHLYGSLWGNELSDVFHGRCPMHLSSAVMPLLQWECTHMGVNIDHSHIEVQQFSMKASFIRRIKSFIHDILQPCFTSRERVLGCLQDVLSRRIIALAPIGDDTLSCQDLQRHGPKVMTTSHSSNAGNGQWQFTQHTSPLYRILTLQLGD
jgi:hypothetical protein